MAAVPALLSRYGIFLLFGILWSMHLFACKSITRILQSTSSVSHEVYIVNFGTVQLCALNFQWYANKAQLLDRFYFNCAHLRISTGYRVEFGLRTIDGVSTKMVTRTMH